MTRTWYTLKIEDRLVTVDKAHRGKYRPGALVNVPLVRIKKLVERDVDLRLDKTQAEAFLGEVVGVGITVESMAGIEELLE